MYFWDKYEGKTSVYLPTVRLVKFEHMAHKAAVDSFSKLHPSACVFVFLKYSPVDAAGGEMQVLVFTSLRASLPLCLPASSLLQHRGMQINIDLEGVRKKIIYSNRRKLNSVKAKEN